jgi:hypothetical protein
MIDPDKLNPAEQWIAEHSIRIFIAVAAVMVVGALVTLKLVIEQGETQKQVDVLRPQVTRTIHAASVCNARALEREDASKACAQRLRIALVNCRSHPSCRAAFLALNYPLPARRGVVPPNPSPTGSQPAPPPGGAHHGGHSPRQKQSPKSSQPPAQAEPAPPPTDTTPGNSPENGHGLKACVDLVVSGCVKADVGKP